MVDVNLRPIRVDDLELILAWRSNPRIYEWFREQESPLSWESHLNWFATRPDARRDYIIEYGGRRVGVASVTENREVSVYVGESSLWGAGIASAALRQLIDREGPPLTAEVHRDNDASRRLFESCGFDTDDADGWLRYEYEP